MDVRIHRKFDNSAKDYRTISVSPLAAAMGAEISGVHIADLSDEQFAEVEEALYRHKMIYFRDQFLDHAQQEYFSRRFGQFAEDAYTDGVPGHRNIHPLVKEADTKVEWVFGDGWHTDSPFISNPPAITLLRAVEIPPYGGDTIWANSALAYNMLSETMRSLLDGLQIHMSMRNVFMGVQRYGNAAVDDPIGALASLNPGDLPEHVKRNIAGNYHPLVRQHPHTGEKSLYCDASYAVGIEGMTDAESTPILKFLAEHITQPAMTCRLRWSAGMVALWDNRLCLHQAFNDYDGFRREYYRSTIAARC